MNPEREPSSQEEAQEMREEIEHFSEPTLAEKFFSQETRPSKARGGKIERGVGTRIERGEIHKVLIGFRKEISAAREAGEHEVEQEKRERLKKLRTGTKEMERSMDEVERQLAESVEIVEVETKYGKFTIPVTVLDLKGENKEGEKDDRVPHIFWGGIRSTAQQNGCAAMAMALAGQKVYIPMHLEQKAVGKPENIAEALGQGDFTVQAEITKEIIKKLGLEKFNLMGYSAGAGIVLETAVQMSEEEEFKGRLNDLIVIEPLGLKDMSVAGLGARFGLNETLRVMANPKARGKVMRQGGQTNQAENTPEGRPLVWETVKTLAKKQAYAEKLGSIEAEGNIQFWVGGKSPITDLPLTERVLQQSGKPISLNIVEGGTHSVLNMGALGMAREFGKDLPGGKRVIKKKELATSAMELISEDVQKQIIEGKL